jgi:hypothetical protein
MNLFAKNTTKLAPVTGRCGSCANFCNDPAYLEKVMPGLTSMGSAHASVRADDGVCQLHDRYLSARASCADFIPIGATNCHIVSAQEFN